MNNSTEKKLHLFRGQAPRRRQETRQGPLREQLSLFTRHSPRISQSPHSIRICYVASEHLPFGAFPNRHPTHRTLSNLSRPDRFSGRNDRHCFEQRWGKQILLKMKQIMGVRPEDVSNSLQKTDGIMISRATPEDAFEFLDNVNLVDLLRPRIIF